MQLMNLHPKYIDLSLDRLRILLKRLDNPHFKLPTTMFPVNVKLPVTVI